MLRALFSSQHPVHGSLAAGVHALTDGNPFFIAYEQPVTRADIRAVKASRPSLRSPRVRIARSWGG
jgi:hypothetical protein